MTVGKCRTVEILEILWVHFGSRRNPDLVAIKTQGISSLTAPPPATTDCPGRQRLDPDSRPLDGEIFREAMSRIAAAVHIVTTDGPGGRFGATVSAVCSVTDEPASILVCLNRESRVHGAILTNRTFCVNTLGAGHEDISDGFAGRGQLDMDARFNRGTWTRLATGCPGLDDALLSVDCQIHSISEVGTHSVIVGSVIDLRLRAPGKSLLYIQRGYERLGK